MSREEFPIEIIEEFILMLKGREVFIEVRDNFSEIKTGEEDEVLNRVKEWERIERLTAS